MQVATIVPQNYLHLIENDDYLMCLGNLLGKPGMERYTEFFKKKAQRKDTFIIMDNGLIENDPRPLSELVTKAYQLGADEMVMTDVFMDKDATLKAIREGVDTLVSANIKYCPPGWLPRLMVVPQGKTIAEWVSCAREIISMLHGGIQYTIGVPKVLVHLEGRDARAVAIQQLLDEVPMVRHLTFHLLGCWTTPLEITMIDRLARNPEWPKIRGVDSAMPFVYARAGKKITHQDRPDSDPIDFEKTVVDERLLRSNIKRWREAADSSKQPLNVGAIVGALL